MNRITTTEDDEIMARCDGTAKRQQEDHAFGAMNRITTTEDDEIMARCDGTAKRQQEDHAFVAPTLSRPMNATEQKRHRTVTQDLQQQMVNLVAVNEELDRRILTLANDAQITRRDVNSHRVCLDRSDQRVFALGHDLKTLLAKSEHYALAEYVAEAHYGLLTTLMGHLPTQRTFWGRLRWLVTGR